MENLVLCLFGLQGEGKSWLGNRLINYITENQIQED